jgi:hypothetical protein
MAVQLNAEAERDLVRAAIDFLDPGMPNPSLLKGNKTIELMCWMLWFR